MKTSTEFNIQPLSKTLGQQVVNKENTDLLALNKASVMQLFQSEGVLLFRDFETNIETFTQFTNKLSKDFMDYTGGVFNRRIINGNGTILSVNDFNHEIKLHGEMYYQKNIPLMLWFFCAHPASQAGETILCDGKQLYDALSQPLKELFYQKNLKYRGHQDKESWQKQYKTHDINIVKQICKNNHSHLTINPDESIDIHYICSAMQHSRYGNDPVFISSLLAAKSMHPESAVFEDDSEIDDSIMNELYRTADKITAEVSWKKGDILMVDNTRIMHGRRAFTDDKRDIYIRLCSPSFPH